jgi:predicted nucleotidyltransferase
MDSPPDELTTLLSRLAAASIEFVLVGGLAAVAQGAPITTHDVDIVHRRAPENVDRLLTFLASIDARYRGRPNHEVLRPTPSALLGPGHSLLMTALGPLDVLGAIEEGRAFADLIPHAIEIDVAGNAVHVLGLPMLVALKRKSTHPKDRYTLAVLEETLRRRGV